MPLYEYQCEACGHRFEKIQKFSDAPIDVCPNCGEKQVHKLVSSPAIQFKGSGWYITDYAKKGTAGTEGSKADKDKSEKAADTKSSSDDKASTSSSSSDKPAAAPAAPAASSTTKDS